MEPNSLMIDENVATAGLMGIGSMWLLFSLVLVVVFIVASWKIFTKAGKPGWASLIPIYNIYVLLKIAGMSGLWLLAFFFPLVQLIASILLAINLAHAFGKSTAYGLILLWFFSGIGMLMLAFGDATYQGAVVVKTTPATPSTPAKIKS